MFTLRKDRKSVECLPRVSLTTDMGNPAEFRVDGIAVGVGSEAVLVVYLVIDFSHRIGAVSGDPMEVVGFISSPHFLVGNGTETGNETPCSVSRYSEATPSES